MIPLVIQPACCNLVAQPVGEARGVIGISISIDTRRKVTYLRGKSNVRLKRCPGYEIAKFSSRELRMEGEVGRSARIDVQALKAIDEANYLK